MVIDVEILKKCLKGKRAAQNELYKTCYSFLMRICTRYENNEEDARALLNAGYLKILDNLKNYNFDLPFENWAAKIMVHLAIDEYRKKKTFNKYFVESEKNIAEFSNNMFEWNEADKVFEIEEVENIVNQLPESSKNVFNLYVFDGFKHKEIAEMLSISENTSKWHLNNARKFIQTKLTELLEKRKDIVA